MYAYHFSIVKFEEKKIKINSYREWTDIVNRFSSIYPLVKRNNYLL